MPDRLCTPPMMYAVSDFFLGIPIEKQDDPAKVKGQFILK